MQPSTKQVLVFVQTGVGYLDLRHLLQSLSVFANSKCLKRGADLNVEHSNDLWDASLQ